MKFILFCVTLDLSDNLTEKHIVQNQTDTVQNLVEFFTIRSHLHFKPEFTSGD